MAREVRLRVAVAGAAENVAGLFEHLGGDALVAGLEVGLGGALVLALLAEDRAGGVVLALEYSSADSRKRFWSWRISAARTNSSASMK